MSTFRIAAASRIAAVAAMVVGGAACGPRGPAPVLVTTAEASSFVRTGRYAEAERLCHDFARAYRRVACDEIGRTIEDRPIVALRVGSPSRPTILIQAGIHAGEIEGKDAGFWFVRDLLDGVVAPGALDAIQLVFVPVMNPDGHERFGPNHRPNQRGPEAMGFRTNAANHNLNRDYLKADAPELRAVLGLITKYDPIVLVDLHTTDGAKFEHDISINVAPLAPRGDGLDRVAAEVSDAVIRALADHGNLPLAFYPSFRTEDDPATGFAKGEPPPRFSHAYASARGRLGILIETHSWRTYRERATSTYRALVAIVERAVADAAAWRTAADKADDFAARLGGARVPLLFDTDDEHHEIEFRGYAYTRVPSDISGGTWTRFDETAPQIWRVPLYDHLVPALEVTAPRAGYVVDGGYAPLVSALLAVHGIRWLPLDDRLELKVDVFRATAVTFAPPFEGRTRATVTGSWQPEVRTVDRGAIFVPIDQPTARLILHLFEPSSPDSLAQWGVFNAIFEAKEYMEAYVVEEVARDMLAADPALVTTWHAALAADPELAQDPRRRLEWFYRRHPAWDERRNLVPVYRADEDPTPIEEL